MQFHCFLIGKNTVKPKSGLISSIWTLADHTNTDDTEHSSYPTEVVTPTNIKKVHKIVLANCTVPKNSKDIKITYRRHFLWLFVHDKPVFQLGHLAFAHSVTKNMMSIILKYFALNISVIFYICSFSCILLVLRLPFPLAITAISSTYIYWNLADLLDSFKRPSSGLYTTPIKNLVFGKRTPQEQFH